MAGIVHYSSKFESSITSVERIIEYLKTPHEVNLIYSIYLTKIYSKYMIGKSKQN
jgi:hypothetical protein